MNDAIKQENNERSTITPYECFKRVNIARVNVGLNKPIPSQMMFNYTSAKLNANKKPMIDSFQRVVDGKKKTFVYEDSFNKWLEKYIAKAQLLATLES